MVAQELDQLDEHCPGVICQGSGSHEKMFKHGQAALWLWLDATCQRLAAAFDHLAPVLQALAAASRRAIPDLSCSFLLLLLEVVHKFVDQNWPWHLILIIIVLRENIFYEGN
jgi:hypothetical protein